MNPAYSVILFTTASGAGYGLLALLGLMGARWGLPTSLLFAGVTLVIALGLITMGLLASTLHLGRPERAWRALSQWKTSWLSREGVAAVLTYPVAFAFGLNWSGLAPYPHAIAPLGMLTALFALTTVFTTGKIYATLTTIRAWNQPLTVPVYLFFALASGGALYLALPLSRVLPFSCWPCSNSAIGRQLMKPRVTVQWAMPPALALMSANGKYRIRQKISCNAKWVSWSPAATPNAYAAYFLFCSHSWGS